MSPPFDPKVRPFRLNTDVAPLLQLAETEAVDRSGEALSEAELRVYLGVPQHNPETDRWVVDHPDGGSLAAQAALQLPSDVDDHRVADGTLSVHPGWRRRGLERRLFERLEARLQAGLVGHHRTTEADFAPHLARLDPDGLFILFAPDSSVAGTVSAEAPDPAERHGVPAGRVGSPGVVSEWRSPELYAALLLFGIAYLRRKAAEVAGMQSWGDDPNVIDRYAAFGFAVTHRQVAFERALRG